MFFEGLGIEKVRFLRGPTFNNSTTLQWFSLFFTFSKNQSLDKFCLKFGSHFDSILEGLGDLGLIFDGFLGGQKSEEKSRSAECAGSPLDLARTPTEIPPMRALYLTIT